MASDETTLLAVSRTALTRAHLSWSVLAGVPTTRGSTPMKRDKAAAKLSRQLGRSPSEEEIDAYIKYRKEQKESQHGEEAAPAPEPTPVPAVESPSAEAAPSKKKKKKKAEASSP